MQAIINKKLITLLLVLTLFLPGGFFVNTAHAAQNPSYVMPDSVFVNSNAMTEAQIQSFLVTRGSYLATYTIPAAFTEAGYYNGTMIGPAGDEVNVTGWKASKVIYQVSQWYGLNPQVTMATLFKEQSWITTLDSTYDLARRLRWSMGYAVTESGIQNVCRTTTNSNPTGSCAGLAMQVDWGAYQLRANYNGSLNKTASYSPYWAGNTITLDGKAVYVGNHSTASLYRYTPHSPYSSNYVWFFNNYFGNIDYTGGVINVYRFYATKSGSHFYTNSTVEKNNIIATLTSYKYEGIAYQLNYSSGKNTVPLFRFYKPGNGSHFYTASLAERNNIIAKLPGYRYEGVAWYVSGSATNSFPVYRFYNVKNGTHFYTSSEAEKSNVANKLSKTYHYEGVAYYISY